MVLSNQPIINTKNKDTLYMKAKTLCVSITNFQSVSQIKGQHCECLQPCVEGTLHSGKYSSRSLPALPEEPPPNIYSDAA